MFKKNLFYFFQSCPTLHILYLEGIYKICVMQPQYGAKFDFYIGCRAPYMLPIFGARFLEFTKLRHAIDGRIKRV